MERLYTLDSLIIENKLLPTIMGALESGQVVYLPNYAFPLLNQENFLLSSNIVSGKAKNISYNAHTKKLGHTDLTDHKLVSLMTMMQRYVDYSTNLIQQLFPNYAKSMTIGRTSFRPVEIKGRPSSYKKDDKRLHVDAFPATPLQGKRILRVFCNINPHDEPRVWNLGEPFEKVAQRFLPAIKPPRTGHAKLLQLFKLTKSLRTPYDHYMLNIHDNMKFDLNYQAKADKLCMPFPAGSTWITYTDVTSHAALTGQYLLEQTFYLNPEDMQMPEKSPLYILQRILNQQLV